MEEIILKIKKWKKYCKKAKRVHEKKNRKSNLCYYWQGKVTGF